MDAHVSVCNSTLHLIIIKGGWCGLVYTRRGVCVARFVTTGKFEDLNCGTSNGMGSTLFMHISLKAVCSFAYTNVI